MTVILGILGVILKILLVILLVVLAVVLAVLLVPIRYRVQGDAYEGKIHAAGTVSWLARLLSIRFLVDRDEQGLRTEKELRIAGISPAEVKRKRAERKRAKRAERRKKELETIRRTDPERYRELKEQARTRRAERGAAEAQTPAADTCAAEEKRPAGGAQAEEGKKPAEEAQIEEVKRPAEEAQTTEGKRPAEEAQTSEEKSPTAEGKNAKDPGPDENKAGADRRRRKIFGRLAYKVNRKLMRLTGNVLSFGIGGLLAAVDLPGRIVSGLGSYMEKLAGILDNAAEWADFLSGDAFRHALGVIARALKRCLRHILPRKLRLSAEFGFEDPSLTGRVLGLGSLLSAGFAGSVVLVPDFDNRKMNGAVEASGRIRLGALLLQALIVVLSRDVRASIKWFRNRKKEAS